jgi:aspartate/glutamate racemase
MTHRGPRPRVDAGLLSADCPEIVVYSANRPEGLKPIDRHGIEALIPGCTELHLILKKDEFETPFLNTTAIRADAIVQTALGPAF